VPGWYAAAPNTMCCPVVKARAPSTRAARTAIEPWWIRTSPSGTPKRGSMTARVDESSGSPTDSSAARTPAGASSGGGGGAALAVVPTGSDTSGSGASASSTAVIRWIVGRSASAMP